MKLIRSSAAGGKSVRIILAIKQIIDLVYSSCLCTYRTSRYLSVSSGFLCECKLYLCQVLSSCYCYNEHTSVHSVMLSNWTVNVFCSVPFWSEIKILSWPENLQSDQFWQFESADFNSFLKGAAGCATHVRSEFLLVPLCGTRPISSHFMLL